MRRLKQSLTHIIFTAGCIYVTQKLINDLSPNFSVMLIRIAK